MLFSCKKQNKEDTIVNFHLYNPVTNEGFSNVTVKIIEQKDVTPPLKLENKYEKKVIWEGVTDVNGKASYSFKTFKSDKYTYWQSVDVSFMNDKKIITQPDYGPISKNTSNTIMFKVVHDNINYIWWIKNTNCFDNNDKFRWRKRSIMNIFDSVWRPWSPLIGSPSYPDGYYEGCFEYTLLHTYSQDIWDIEMEVTKNGITTIVRDTFYLTGQNGTDTLKLFY